MKKAVSVILIVVASIIVFCFVFLIAFVIGMATPLARSMEALYVDWNEDVGRISYDLKYGEWADTAYDLYIPKELKGDKEGALVLFIHGGSYTSGDKSDLDMWCKFFTSLGYVSATVNYTLASETVNSNINLMNEQIYSSVGAIKEKCVSLGIDLSQMAISGQSAGGHLAMLYAYSHYEDSPIPVKFVFQQTGPASFEPSLWGSDEADAAAEFLSGMSGNTVTAEMINDGSYKAICDEISPLAYVNENTVPTLIAYGTKDMVVPGEIKYLLIDALDEHGIEYDYIEFTNSGHSMAADPDKYTEFINKSVEYCDKYFN